MFKRVVTLSLSSGGCIIAGDSSSYSNEFLDILKKALSKPVVSLINQFYKQHIFNFACYSVDRKRWEVQEKRFVHSGEIGVRWGGWISMHGYFVLTQWQAKKWFWFEWFWGFRPSDMLFLLHMWAGNMMKMSKIDYKCVLNSEKMNVKDKNKYAHV